MTKALNCPVNTLIVGHRGAPGYMPEHTLQSYNIALDNGADYIEPDLVPTKDGFLVVRHENEISETTNITDYTKKYANRKKTKIIDGVSKTGWFTEDFTLGEIKELRAKERLPFRSHANDGKYEVPTFDEVLMFVKLQEKKRSRPIGIAIEIKHSAYFNKLGFDVERKIVHLLKKYNLNFKDSMVMIQSFEVENLRRLRQMTPVNLVQLIDAPPRWPYDFNTIREYAEWVSPPKNAVVKIGKNGEVSEITDFVQKAHTAGLKVVPYTFRSDGDFLMRAYKGDPANEYRLFFNQGIDGLFSDFSDHAVAAKKDYAEKCKERMNLIK
ncbi:MAG: hypothetical protein A2Z20_03745 [Bdellovibrionales bacterium RBG_16_40_8]|nr:MAG: hypothetical protein A2Z20_03745 [Bdellovibrionales bacterium RBG_16_40_8]